jgi:LemA protein
MVAYVLLGLLVLIALWSVSAYNGLVGMRNQVRNAFAQIDVQLKRRYDLIPNLVETAKAYVKHERETLEAVMQARNGALQAHAGASADPTDAGAMRQLASAESALGGALTRFFAVAEAYPDLKANASLMQVSEELSSTENRIAFARQAFNDSVMGFNNAVQQFPGNLVANAFGFHLAEPLAATTAEAERQPVRVQFQ